MVAYLCDYVEQFLAPSEISCHLDVASDLPDLPLSAQTRRNLLLAVKEALSNSTRHAGARIIQLKICLEHGWLNVEISDDGHGFNAADARPGGKGLSNIRNRMELINGKAEIRSTISGGTTVTLSVMLPGSEVRQ